MLEKELKILIAEDHPIYRQGLVQLVSQEKSNWEFTQASNGTEAIEQFNENAFDVVLLDIEMPNKNGLDVLAELRSKKELHPFSVIMLSTYSNYHFILEASRLGANGYVVKDSSLEELIQAIEMVIEGNEYFHPKLAKTYFPIGLSTLTDKIDDTVELTHQERVIIRMVCLQLTNEQIATQLRISLNTVRRHKQNIAELIGAKTLIGFLSYSLKNELVRLDEL